MTRLEIIKQTIENQYNPEADIPGPYNHPKVTATDIRLLEAIEILEIEIARLEKRVFELEKKTTPEDEGGY